MRTFSKLSLVQQVLFAKRLALYLQAGISIVEALEYLQHDAQSAAAKILYQHLKETVLRGMPLSVGLEPYSSTFDAFTIGFIRVGESSGTLSQTLERLAIHLQKRAALKQKVISALTYPAIVLLATIGVGSFLALYIFPKIVPVLNGFHTKLPFATRVLIKMNFVIAHYWPALILVVILLCLTLLTARRVRSTRRILEQISIHAPILRALHREYILALFSRTLSLQLTGGVRIIPSLVLTGTGLPGVLYPEAIQSIEQAVTRGLRLSASLAEYPKLFPPTVCQMVSAGEATGTLSANLSALADMHEEHLDELTRNLTVLVEPALMIVMGFVVGFIALAIITPIYQVTQSITV
jgi:type IV pilus assembly protein PilC